MSAVNFWLKHAYFLDGKILSFDFAHYIMNKNYMVSIVYTKVTTFNVYVSLAKHYVVHY